MDACNNLMFSQAIIQAATGAVIALEKVIGIVSDTVVPLSKDHPVKRTPLF